MRKQTEWGYLGLILLATSLQQVTAAILGGIPVATYAAILEKFSERIAKQW